MNKRLKRQLELAGLLNENKQTKSLPSMELVKEGLDGMTYAIVRENKKYFIKKAETKQNLTEHDFDFLHGLANKIKSGYRSFEDATVKLNLIFEDINRNFDGKETNILESDMLDEKKYVLKQPKPKTTNYKLTPEPEMDFGAEEGGDEFDFGSEEGEGDEFDFGGEEEGGDEEFDFGAEEGGEGDEEFDFGGDEEGDTEGGDEEFDFGGDEEMDLGDEEAEEDFGLETGDNIKDIQKLTGKLGQELRDTEDISSDMQKWVAKSVLAALNMDTLDDSDKQDIVSSITDKDELEEVVIPTVSDDDDDYHDYDADLTGPGGPNWSLPRVEEDDDDWSQYDLKEYDEDLETGRGGERDLDDEQLLYDNTIEEEDNVLRASDLGGDDDEHEYDPSLDSQGGPNWSLPRQGSRRAFRKGLGESVENLNEDHFNDRMETHEQLNAYLDLEDMIRSYDFELGWCHKEKDEDPERKTIYLDLKDGNEKLAKVRINSIGDMEIGYMEGKNFIGEPLDSLSDIDEYLGETVNESDMMENDREEAPTKTPTRTKPDTRPGRKRPFQPPRPSEDPDPKASDREETPTKTPTRTKPGTKPGRKRPFQPPRPSEDPDPKAGYDDDVEFE
jgi:hypothetical protein